MSVFKRKQELKFMKSMVTSNSSTKEVNCIRYSVTLRSRKCSQLLFLKLWTRNWKRERASLSTSLGVRHFTTTFNTDKLWANCQPNPVSVSKETLVYFREFPQTIFHLLTIYEKQFVYLLHCLFTSSPHMTCFFTLLVHIYTGIINGGLNRPFATLEKSCFKKKRDFVPIDTTFTNDVFIDKIYWIGNGRNFALV